MKSVLVLITGVAVVVLASCSADHGKPNATAAPSSSTERTAVPADGATPTTGGPVTTASPAAGPTSTPSVPPPRPPATSSQSAEEQAVSILAYLRSNFGDAAWLGSVEQIQVKGGGAAYLPTKITADGRGESIARQICGAVLGNDRVSLSMVTVGGAGGSTAAVCQH